MRWLLWLLLLVAARAYHPSPSINWPKPQHQMLGLTQQVRMRFGSKVFTGLQRPLAATQRPSVAQPMLEHPAYIALAQGLEQAATSESPSTILTPLVQAMLNTSALFNPVAWTPKTVVHLVRAAQLTSNPGLARSVWQKAAPVIEHVVADMNTKGIVSVVSAMHGIFSPFHAYRWANGIISAVATRIRAQQIASWTTDDVVAILHSLADLNFRTPAMNSLVQAVVPIIEQLSGQFSASQLVHALRGTHNAMHYNETIHLPIMLAKQLNKTSWADENPWLMVSSLLRFPEYTTFGREVASTLAQRLPDIPKPSANDSSRVLVAFARLQSYSTANPELTALMHAMEPHVVQAASVANTSTDLWGLLALSGFRGKQLTPQVRNMLSHVTSFVEKAEYCEKPTALCAAFTGLVGLDPREAEVARMLDVLTSKLNASERALPDVRSVVKIAEALPTLWRATPETRRFWTVLAAAISRVKLAPNAMDLLQLYYKIPAFTHKVHETEQLMLAITGLEKPLQHPKVAVDRLPEIFRRIVAVNVTLTDLSENLDRLLDSCSTIRADQIDGLLNLAVQLPENDTLRHKLLEACSSCVRPDNLSLDYRDWRTIARCLRQLPYDHRVQTLCKHLTPTLPKRLTRRQVSGLSVMFANMPISDPTVRQLQDTIATARAASTLEYLASRSTERKERDPFASTPVSGTKSS